MYVCMYVCIVCMYCMYVLFTEVWPFMFDISGLSIVNTTDHHICVLCPDDGVSKKCVEVTHPSQELQPATSQEFSRSDGGMYFPQQEDGEYTITVFTQITMSKPIM